MVQRRRWYIGVVPAPRKAPKFRGYQIYVEVPEVAFVGGAFEPANECVQREAEQSEAGRAPRLEEQRKENAMDFIRSE